IPIVFTTVADPVGAGFVESLARPGGNATGFIAFEYGLGTKWLELLKEIAPRVTRVAVIRDPAPSARGGPWGAIPNSASSNGVGPRPPYLSGPPQLWGAVVALPAPPHGAR